MAKVNRRTLQWHLVKLEPHVTSRNIALARTHYALRADGLVIQRIVVLELNKTKQKDLGWKVFPSKQTAAELFAELTERGFRDVGVD